MLDLFHHYKVIINLAVGNVYTFRTLSLYCHAKHPPRQPSVGKIYRCQRLFRPLDRWTLPLAAEQYRFPGHTHHVTDTIVTELSSFSAKTFNKRWRSNKNSDISVLLWRTRQNKTRGKKEEANKEEQPSAKQIQSSDLIYDLLTFRLNPSYRAMPTNRRHKTREALCSPAVGASSNST